MFRCTDCGQEFDIKPEYCDCGNNVFEEIVIKPTEQTNKELLNPPKNEYTQEYQRKSLDEQISPLAMVIFGFCLILSLVSVIFIGKNSDTNTKPETQKITQEKPKQNIPSINTFWDNTPAAVKVAAVQPVPVQAKPVEVQKPVQTVKPVQKPVTTAKQPTQTQKPKTTVQQPKKTETKPVQTQKQTVVAQKPAQTSQTTTKVDVSKYIPKQTTATTTQTQSQTTQTVQKAPEQPKVDTAAQQKELLNYKIALRNKIASNINFVQVVGDGNCKITFKIDANGNLVNRSFAVQSPNNSLNDVVYNAMMRNPTFKTPPAGYKNETLTLSVKMYSGNFEVDLR